jgi:hypothetical protein
VGDLAPASRPARDRRPRNRVTDAAAGLARSAAKENEDVPRAVDFGGGPGVMVTSLRR